MQKTYLIHHGIKGQKWGIIRFQNEDGSLTPEGEKRYGITSKEYVNTRTEFQKNMEKFDSLEYRNNISKESKQSIIQNTEKINNNKLFKKYGYRIDIDYDNYPSLYDMKENKQVPMDPDDDSWYTLPGTIINETRIGYDYKKMSEQERNDLDNIFLLIDDNERKFSEISNAEQDHHYGRDKAWDELFDNNPDLAKKYNNALKKISEDLYEDEKFKKTAESRKANVKTMLALSAIGAIAIGTLAAVHIFNKGDGK